MVDPGELSRKPPTLKCFVWLLAWKDCTPEMFSEIANVRLKKPKVHCIPNDPCMVYGIHIIMYLQLVNVCVCVRWVNNHTLILSAWITRWTSVSSKQLEWQKGSLMREFTEKPQESVNAMWPPIGNFGGDLERTEKQSKEQHVFRWRYVPSIVNGDKKFLERSRMFLNKSISYYANYKTIRPLILFYYTILPRILWTFPILCNSFLQISTAKKMLRGYGFVSMANKASIFHHGESELFVPVKIFSVGVCSGLLWRSKKHSLKLGIMEKSSLGM